MRYYRSLNRYLIQASEDNINWNTVIELPIFDIKSASKFFQMLSDLNRPEEPTALDLFKDWIKKHPDKEISISTNKYNTTVCLWNTENRNKQVELNFNNSGELTDWFINDEE